ncbi:MAG: 4Fe-4S binding protein [Tissierellia bacterium]|nr:4Fe-4S binding protein [Tissierellia bacterium]
MRIAVLSGKGGTGKTLLSVNMAAAASTTSQYLDCDVEEPNGHLYFKPEELITEDVNVKIPFVDPILCNGCRKCVEFCKFNALAYINKLIVFEDICHSCGGCTILCPENALSEKDKSIGRIERGISENVRVLSGILNIGQASGVPIINQLLKESSKSEDITIIDCPPGSACIVMESIKDADYCLLVAEPTLFGVHNLDMVVELVELFNKPYGVVINKSMNGENPVRDYCEEKGIKILEEIPFDNELGTLNSNALIATRESEKYNKIFTSILETIVMEVEHETVIST